MLLLIIQIGGDLVGLLSTANCRVLTAHRSVKHRENARKLT